ncbi:hypothetical protein MRQ36_29200 [Micromonospora sp. R77]|uniref:hypothetical protein n=1 Tax=Micromonospora sp. R77 TaxID=2925836 RepID=UPI001F61A5EA|nr:hypothetical protein [Micromonospora sp. R77]MCI4066413.1 hypothetical protein [Micromonospora sp. R77]
MARPENDARTGSPVRGRHDRLPLLFAVVLGGAGLGYRLVMLLLDVPPSNSDEATMGLAALHISEGRHWPAFFYGQHYMGTLEAYLAAPIVAWLGPSVLALRLPLLLLYTAFLALLWLLTRWLYSPWLATFTVGLLALGSDRILKNQLIAGGGYPEINPLGVLLLLLAVALALGRIRRRTVGYAAWGLVAGVLVWDNWLIMPYLAAAGVLLLAADRRQVLRRGGRDGVALLGGLLLGAAPMLVHAVDTGRDPFSVFLGLSGGGQAGSADRLYGGVIFGLPMGTGMCAPSHCQPWQLWWGLAYPVLLVAAGVLAWRGLRRTTGGVTGPGRDVEPDGPRVWSADRVRQAARLALVGAAGASLVSYALSSAAGATPVESARYLHCLLISTPAVLWPLWRLAGRSDGRDGDGGPRRAYRIGARATLAGVIGTALVATTGLVGQAADYQRLAEQRRDLVATLRADGVRHVYADYWTCNNITFATGEEIVCAVLGEDLRAGLDRYLPYRDDVNRAPRPTFVLPEGSTVSAAVSGHLTGEGIDPQARHVAGYDIYQPRERGGLPRP